MFSHKLCVCLSIHFGQLWGEDMRKIIKPYYLWVACEIICHLNIYFSSCTNIWETVILLMCCFSYIIHWCFPTSKAICSCSCFKDIVKFSSHCFNLLYKRKMHKNLWPASYFLFAISKYSSENRFLANTVSYSWIFSEGGENNADLVSFYIVLSYKCSKTWTQNITM